MKKFALFCEGVSENRMITYITERYLGEEVMVDGIYPSVKEAHGQLVQDDFGGWKAVLDHCNEADFDSALDGHDYLIIQIDTDTCHQAHYDVRTEEGGQRLPDAVIYEKVKERILRDISEDKRREYDGRLIFAICFNETECWLLPIYYERNQKQCERTNSCIYALNQALQKQSLGIPDKAKNSPGAIKTYDKILKQMKRKNIPVFAQYNYGFKSFIEQLDKVNAEQ